MEKIKKSLTLNKSRKVYFNESYSYSLGENNFFYFEDEYGGLKLPIPNLIGDFQLSNVATAIAALRSIDELNILDNNIKDGITRIQSLARFQEIKSGKLKKIVNKNKLFVDGAHNPLAAKALNDYLDKINSNKHVIIGMMLNKEHKK